MIRFVTWDWKGGLTAEYLADRINEFDQRPVYAVAVQNGGDDYVLALSDEPIGSHEATRAWRDS
jgi:hypothetical protein